MSTKSNEKPGVKVTAKIIGQHEARVTIEVSGQKKPIECFARYYPMLPSGHPGRWQGSIQLLGEGPRFVAKEAVKQAFAN